MKIKKVFYWCGLLAVLLTFYLILDKNLINELTNWKTVSTEGYNYDQNSRKTIAIYAAATIFDPGYVREIGNDLIQRLFIYPNNESFKSGFFEVAANTEKSIKLILPIGYQQGILSFRAMANSSFKIEISADLKNWQMAEYPGFNYLTYGLIDLTDKKWFEKKEVYLKFLPPDDGSLTLDFSAFQYLTSLPKDRGEDAGILFFPEIDIDYQGKQVIHEAIYAKKNPQPNN